MYVFCFYLWDIFLSLTLSVDRHFQHFKNGIPLWCCISNGKLPVISPVPPCDSVCFPLVLGIDTLSLFLPIWMWSLPLGFLGFLLCIDLYPKPMKSYLVEESYCFKSYFLSYFPVFNLFSSASEFQSFEQEFSVSHKSPEPCPFSLQPSLHPRYNLYVTLEKKKT